MKVMDNHSNEQQAATAFSKQSVVFDTIYGEDGIIQYKRQRVRAHFAKHVPYGSSILELNCGTGEDAVFFASEGYRVHATDAATGMLNVLQQKVQHYNLQNRISHELCSYTQLDQLAQKGPYNALFSNFGGLNCTGELDTVLRSFDGLLQPGGTATLVIISPFCLWEFLLVFKGMFRTATRRFFSSGGRKARVENTFFKCWYYAPSYITRHLPAHFELVSLEGLCTIVPPSYIADFDKKHPRLFSFLKRKENQWKSKWPFRQMGDYYIITVRKRD